MLSLQLCSWLFLHVPSAGQLCVSVSTDPALGRSWGTVCSPRATRNEKCKRVQKGAKGSTNHRRQERLRKSAIPADSAWSSVLWVPGVISTSTLYPGPCGQDTQNQTEAKQTLLCFLWRSWKITQTKTFQDSDNRRLQPSTNQFRRAKQFWRNSWLYV